MICLKILKYHQKPFSETLQDNILTLQFKNTLICSNVKNYRIKWNLLKVKFAMSRISKKDTTHARVRRLLKEKNIENSSTYVYKKQDFDAINFNKLISYNLYYC